MAKWKSRLAERRKSYRLPSVTKSRRLVALTKLTFIGVLVVFLASFLIIPLLAFNLPSPDKVVRREGFSFWNLS